MGNLRDIQESFRQALNMKHGEYRLTDEGLKEVKPKPITVTVKKDLLSDETVEVEVKPEHNFYGAIEKWGGKK